MARSRDRWLVQEKDDWVKGRVAGEDNGGYVKRRVARTREGRLVKRREARSREGDWSREWWLVKTKGTR